MTGTRRAGIMALLIIAVFSVFPASSQDTKDAGAESTVIYGRIEHSSAEGDFYMIVGDDGEQYKPINLSSAFEIEGLRIRADVRIMDRKLLFNSWYVPVEIIDIQKEGRLKSPDGREKP